MFTGIIAAIGQVESVQPSEGDLRLDIATQQLDLETKIVYCKESKRQGNYQEIKFDFPMRLSR